MPGPSTRDRLLAEEVLAAPDRGVDVDWPKTGRRRQQDEIAVGNYLLIGVEAGEDLVVVDGDAIADAARAAQPADAASARSRKASPTA